MSYARNLARIARTGAPSVDSLQDLRNLPIYDGLYPTGVIARWHTTKGDGGGGYFNIITGEVPGTFVDDDGVTVVFTGGDGSAAAVREIVGFVTPQMFGAVADAVWVTDHFEGTDATAAIQACYDYHVVCDIPVQLIGKYLIDGTLDFSLGGCITGATASGPTGHTLADPQSGYGGVLCAGPSVTSVLGTDDMYTNPVIRVSNPGGTGRRVTPLKISGISILGAGVWLSGPTYADPANELRSPRCAIQFEHKSWQWLEDVFIAGFQYSAIAAIQLWDSHMLRCRINECGLDDATHYSLYLPGSTGPNQGSNSMVVDTCNFENLHSYMFLQNLRTAWQCNFINCKFERREIPIFQNPPFKFDKSGEIRFDHCRFFFGYDPAQAGYATRAPVFKSEDTSTLMFDSPLFSGENAVWLHQDKAGHVGRSIVMQAPVFWLPATEQPFLVLSDNVKMSDVTLMQRTETGKPRNGMSLGDFCTIDGITVQQFTGSTAPTGGTLFLMEKPDGSRNSRYSSISSMSIIFNTETQLPKDIIGDLLKTGDDSAESYSTHKVRMAYPSETHLTQQSQADAALVLDVSAIDCVVGDGLTQNVTLNGLGRGFNGQQVAITNTTPGFSITLKDRQTSPGQLGYFIMRESGGLNHLVLASGDTATFQASKGNNWYLVSSNIA